MAAQFNVQVDAGTTALANAYITLAEFKQYHDNAGNDYSAYIDAKIQLAIVRATFYLDNRFTFPGRKTVVVDPAASPPVTVEQPTQWPRIEPQVYSNSGYGFGYGDQFGYGFSDPFIYSGTPVSNTLPTGIPVPLKNAVAEYALRALSAQLFIDNPGPSDGRLVKSQTDKVDVIETTVEYATAGLQMNGGFVMPAFPLADLMLRRAGLVTNTGRVLVR